jgi:hypothetical protein
VDDAAGVKMRHRHRNSEDDLRERSPANLVGRRAPITPQQIIQASVRHKVRQRPDDRLAITQDTPQPDRSGAAHHQRRSQRSKHPKPFLGTERSNIVARDAGLARRRLRDFEDPDNRALTDGIAAKRIESAI